MSTTQRVSLNGSLAILRTYYDALTSVPLSSDWAIQEVDIGEGVVLKMRDIGAAHVVERGDARRRYELAPAFARRLDEFEPKGPQLPCGHHGYHNIVGGEGYLCAFEQCGARFDRETIEGVLEG